MFLKEIQPQEAKQKLWGHPRQTLVAWDCVPAYSVGTLGPYRVRNIKKTGDWTHPWSMCLWRWMFHEGNPKKWYMALSENVVYYPKPIGFADHYPYEKWLFHWEYTLFSDKPI